MKPGRYCQHATCRAHAVEELAFMARTLKRSDIQAFVAKAQRASVRCRRLPRKGPIHVPFAIPRRRSQP